MELYLEQFTIIIIVIVYKSILELTKFSLSWFNFIIITIL